MTLVYDLADPTELVGYARRFANEVLTNTFTGNTLLPNRTVDDIEYALKRSGLTDVDIAKYRPWDVPAPMTGRPGVARIRGEIAPVSRQIALSEEEGLRLRALERDSNDEIVNAIFDDTERMIRAVEARIEVARFDTLIDGKCTLHEHGLALEVDYGMPTDQKVTVSTAWTVANKATATPITDMLAIQAAAVARGTRIGKIVMSSLRLPALLVNDEVRDYVAGGGNVPVRVRLDDIQAVLQEQGLPAIEFYDTMVRDNGVQKYVLPPEYVLMLPAERYGETLYGPTAEGVLLASKGYITARQASGLVAVVTQNDHPVQTFTVGSGVALPVVPNSELLFTLKVDVSDPTTTVIAQF
jgi:hypothetical protein